MTRVRKKIITHLYSSLGHPSEAYKEFLFSIKSTTEAD